MIFFCSFDFTAVLLRCCTAYFNCFSNPKSTFMVMKVIWLGCLKKKLHLWYSLQPRNCSLLLRMLVVVQVILAIGKYYIYIYKVCIFNNNSCLLPLCLGHEQWLWWQWGLFLMYISFRFYRSSMEHEYNLKGNLIQENISIFNHCGKFTKVK